MGVSALTQLLYHAATMYHLTLMIVQRLQRGDYTSAETIVEDMLDHLSFTMTAGTMTMLFLCVWLALGALVQ